MPMIGPSCATQLSCPEQNSLDVVLDVLSVSISYTCRCTYMLVDFVCVEVKRPVNTMGSCQAWSVYLTTHLLGKLSPLSG